MAITVVCGPPGAGKSKFVREQKRRADLVWDHDLIANALTGCTLSKYDQPQTILPFVMSARGSILGLLGNTRIPAWIIVTEVQSARRIGQQLSAEVVVVETDPSQCLKNIVDDPDRGAQAMELTKPLIDKWWKAYS